MTVNVSGQQALQTPNDAAAGWRRHLQLRDHGHHVRRGTGGYDLRCRNGAADTFMGRRRRPANILSFDNLPSGLRSGPLRCAWWAAPAARRGEALLGSVHGAVLEYHHYVGLPGGNTTFVAGTPEAALQHLPGDGVQQQHRLLGRAGVGDVTRQPAGPGRHP